MAWAGSRQVNRCASTSQLIQFPEEPIPPRISIKTLSGFQFNERDTNKNYAIVRDARSFSLLVEAVWRRYWDYFLDLGGHPLDYSMTIAPGLLILHSTVYFLQMRACERSVWAYLPLARYDMLHRISLSGNSEIPV